MRNFRDRMDQMRADMDRRRREVMEDVERRRAEVSCLPSPMSSLFGCGGVRASVSVSWVSCAGRVHRQLMLGVLFL